jgi:hypothetical protein
MACQFPCRSGTRCFNEADEPPVLAVETGKDGARDGGRLAHAPLGSFQQAHRAVQLDVASVPQVDLDQVGWHGPMVAGSPAHHIAVNTD